MPTFTLMPLMKCRAIALLLALGVAAAACQARHDGAETAALPPVGHYEGSLSVAGQPEVRAALDIRHPSPGHYEAELSAPAASALSFVADTIFFANNQLRLVRPARPGQALALTLDGDFWRGALTLDSVQASLILLRRGEPSPSTYRVEQVPQANGSAWLFSPADTGTAGPAVALLPDSATAAAAPLWADALARNGVIALVLPATGDATVAAEIPRLEAALRLLHGTAGADTATLGAWAAGPRTAALAQALRGADGLRVAFAIIQNAAAGPEERTALRELRKQKLPVLGLYGGPAGTARAATLRNAMGGRRDATVRAYRTAGTDLLVPGGLGPRLGPGLPDDVLEWLRGRSAAQ